MADTIRRPKIRVEIDRWDWPADGNGSLIETRDVTNDVLNYRFQKSIKTISGSCQISILPQRATVHILDEISNMDVVRIYEFDVLKFIGYVTRVSYDGSIGQDGKPNRGATITVKQMGGILESASLGLGLGVGLGKDKDWMVASKILLSSLMRASADGTSFSEILALVIDSWYKFIGKLGATGFQTYLNTYFDVSTGLSPDTHPVAPKSYSLYTGTEMSITLWETVQQIVDSPFNELWIDNGPREVSVNGKTVSLSEKASLVFRPTPFNGRVVGKGAPMNEFDALPIIFIDRDHLTGFGIAKSMDEVYTTYAVKEPAFLLSDVTRIFLGQHVIDSPKVNQFLLKPLVTELFFTRMVSQDGSKDEVTKGTLEGVALDGAKTLKNWFTNNDKYISGAISMMVPSDATQDPRIGDRIQVYGVEGYFYVEGISHVWTYGGSLRSDLSVTRGFNGSVPMTFKNSLFVRGEI